jgi:hypothetical protein
MIDDSRVHRPQDSVGDIRGSGNLEKVTAGVYQFRFPDKAGTILRRYIVATSGSGIANPPLAIANFACPFPS